MIKICSLAISAILLSLLLFGCSKITTVTVTATPPPVTETVTRTLTTTQILTTAATQAPPQASTTTVIIYTTITPTATVKGSIYQGSLNCTWTGQISNGETSSGNFTLNIDANGDITGTANGSLSGTIVGNVDLVGNLIAMGILTGSTTPISTSYDAKLTLSGKSLSVQGSWIAGTSSGTFSGAGNTAY